MSQKKIVPKNTSTNKNSSNSNKRVEKNIKSEKSFESSKKHDENFKKTIKVDVSKEIDKDKNSKKINKNKKRTFNNAFLWGGCLGVFLVVILLIQFLLFPHIRLKGGDKIVVEYQDKYTEKGYKASHFGEDITEDVKVSGSVNTEKLGSYKVTYKVGSGILSRKKVRVVEVADTLAPELSIQEGDSYVCPGSKYQEEEVTALDNYDGDLTKKVKSSIRKNKVTYSVVDSHGNKKSVTRNILYEDVEKPVITLVGAEEMDLCANDVYKDPGYKAVDNCDLDLTSKVVVEGSVDNSLIGDYDLTYKVSDQAGNEGVASRKIHVGNSDNPGVVYLTFDDGPNEGTTNVILDILKEEGVEATFFVTSKGPDELIVREYNEGHTVALHTSSHDYASVYASDDAFFQDLQTVSDRVERLTGIRSKFIRFPGGSSNTVSRRYSTGIMSRLTKEVQNRGYKYYDWNISSGDAGNTTDPNQVYANVVNSLRKDRVNMVLMHDIKPYTRDALRNIIHYCKENGYQMKKINNCTTMVTQRVNN